MALKLAKRVVEGKLIPNLLWSAYGVSCRAGALWSLRSRLLWRVRPMKLGSPDPQSLCEGGLGVSVFELGE
jgi:hypothetical protein